MHGAFGNAAPHGPWIMHLTTVSWVKPFVSRFESLALIMRSTSSIVCGLQSLAKKMRIVHAAAHAFEIQ
jgi:hypothetical protein